MRYEVGSSPNAVAATDLTGDGIPDLIVIGSTFDTAVNVLPGKADGTFGAPVVTTLDLSNGSLLATGIFNEAGGKTDLVLQTYPSGLAILPGNGDGTFQTPVSLHSGADAVTIADVNGDGHLDVVTTASSWIQVFLGDGQGAFTGPFRTPLWSSESLAVGDVDGDGIPDVVSTRSVGGSSADTLVYFPGRGDGTFNPSVTIVTLGGDGFRHVQLADLTGDGKLDIIATKGFTIQVLAGHDDGTFDAPVQTFAPPSPAVFSISDFDGDGRPDLALSQTDPFNPSSSGGLDIFLGNGDGSFAYNATYATGSGLWALATADFGNQGRNGVVTVGYPDTAAWVLAGNGDGTLRSELLNDTGSAVLALTTADFNEDGRPDIGSLVYLNAGGSVIFYSLGGPQGRFSSGGSISAGPSPAGLQSGDLNGDGHADLATLRRDTSALVVFAGDGHGAFTFWTSTSVPTASYGSKLYFADLDGDTVLDVISVDTDPAATALQVGVLLNNGDGTFHAAPTLSFPVPVTDAAVADFNGDGRADLAIVGGLPGQAGNLFLLLGNGDGSFQAPIVSPTDAQPTSVAVGFADGGTRVDLVIGQEWPAPLLVLLGQGDGGFAAPIPLDLGLYASAMAIADFRGAGVTDLLVAGGNQATLLTGSGDGTFGSPTAYPYGTWLTTLALGDFDGNSSLDAVVGNGNILSGGFMLLRNANRAVVIPGAPTAAPGQRIDLVAEASGLGQLTYAWRKGGVPLSDGGAISGSHTATLTIDPASFADAGSYDVIVTDSCGSTGSNSASLSVEFADVPASSPFHADILTVAIAGITAGCGGGNYCPASPVRRDQMAVFLLKSEHGSGYLPPNCTGLFADVACPGPFTNWVEQLSAEGVTTGCGGGNYCPANSVTRAQMAVFLLKTSLGSGYAPPAATGIFNDVPTGSFAADFIEDLYNRAISGGCSASPLLYCPNNPVLRQQMATFLVRTFAP